MDIGRRRGEKNSLHKILGHSVCNIQYNVWFQDLSASRELLERQRSLLRARARLMRSPATKVKYF